jgi:hypothetical protein
MIIMIVGIGVIRCLIPAPCTADSSGRMVLHRDMSLDIGFPRDSSAKHLRCGVTVVLLGIPRGPARQSCGG